MLSLDIVKTKEIPEEPEFDPPNGSKWIVAIDYQGLVSILSAPNIHPSFFDHGKDAESVGLPCDGFDGSVSGVYEWVCVLAESRDWDSGIIDDWWFEVQEEELLWKVEVS